MGTRAVAAACLAYGLSAIDTQVHAAIPDYANLSLEQLMKIEVTSAAKRPESIANTPAAIFVLTNEDIRRMGARSIPEALRMVPGLNVAQISAGIWAISARGFNGRFANKLLVLMDGRSVYTPLFSGVYWDRQDTLLEDIERIEVIRGPGAALWGANAVNGVINIITKNARDTQGGYASAGAGTGDEVRGDARYGAALGEYGHYRVYGKAFNLGARPNDDGTDGADDWRSGQAGFRMDLTDGDGDEWHLQGASLTSVVGDTYVTPSLTAPFSQRSTDDATVTSNYILGSWGRDLGPDRRLEVRSSFQHEVFDDPRLYQERSTVDLEATHRSKLGDRHQVVVGVGGRYSKDDMDETFLFGFEPDSDDQYLLNAFAQDTMTFWNGTVELTLGSKFEYNNYTGFEVQPNVRALWHVDERHTVWAAVSRAVRTPSRAESDVEVSSTVIPPTAATGGLPTVARFVGNRSTVSEELLALEAGHRWQAAENLSFDLSGFYNFYDRLVSASAGTAFVSTSGGIPHVVLPLNTNNDGEADVYGFELVGNVRPSSALRLQAWYAYLETDVSGSLDSNHQFGARSLYNVSPTVTFDTTVRHVSEIDASDIDAYTEIGVRLAWRPETNLELAITGQNLLHDERREFGGDALAGSQATKVERSIFGSMSLKF